MLKGFTVRRACATLALIALVVAAGACGSGTSDNSGGASGGKTTLTLKGITDNRKTWEELIASYKKANPDVTIKGSYAPTDQLQTALRAQLGAGARPICSSSGRATAARCRSSSWRPAGCSRTCPTRAG